MFCPVCSQQQISEQTRFCSRCGFLLTGVSQLIERGGAPTNLSSADSQLISPRRRGINQGVVLMLSSLVLIPLIAILAMSLRIGPTPIAVTAIITVWSGILRIIYALIFESSQPSIDAQHNILPAFISKKMPGTKQSAASLPEARDYPVSAYAPPEKSDWRDTNEFAAPPSVTDHTTKFLTKE